MPPRTTSACNVCRSRKQRCSGSINSASCEQCKSTRRRCTWPQAKKRGPQKGYTESLEIRLHELENLLQELLPCISPEQLEEACSDLSRDVTMINTTTQTNYSDRSITEDWKTYPLTTPANVRRWNDLYSVVINPQEMFPIEVESSSTRAMVHADTAHNVHIPPRATSDYIEDDIEMPSTQGGGEHSGQTNEHLISNTELTPDPALEVESYASSMIPAEFQKRFFW